MLTNWKGGHTGLIPLGTRGTSLWYTKVVGEIPRAYTGLGGSPYSVKGYHLVGQHHQTNYIPYAGSLKVYVDGTEVAVSVFGGDSNRFELDDDRAGWIMVEYLPTSIIDNWLFVGKKTIERTNFAHALSPLLKSHLTVLLTAINNAERDINLEATLWQVGRLGSLSDTATVTTSSILDKGLFTQIATAINYLRFVMTHTHQRSISGSNLSSSWNIVDPAFIADARVQVNNIEAAIVTI